MNEHLVIVWSLRDFQKREWEYRQEPDLQAMRYRFRRNLKAAEMEAISPSYYWGRHWEAPKA